MTTTTMTPKRTFFFSLRWRLLLLFTVLFLATLAGVFLWFESFATSEAMSRLQDDLLATARTAASGIDGDQHQRLFEKGALDDADYLAINEYLRSIKYTNPNASGIYTYVQKTGEPNQARFVVSAAIPPGVAPNPRDEQVKTLAPAGCQIRPESRPGLGDPFTVEGGYTPAMAQALIEPTIDKDPYTDDWGEWISGAAPIYNSKKEVVGAVGVDMCIAKVRAVQTKIESILLPVFGLVVALLAFAVYVIADRLTRPIITLTHAADQIGRGNYETEIKTGSGRLRNEVDSLANVFTLMVDKVREREDKLKQQVAELQIIVDEGKRKRQVDEIVDSDFFRSLQSKAREARMRRDRGGEPEPT